MIKTLLQIRDECNDAMAWLKWVLQHNAEKPWSSLSSPGHITQALVEVKQIQARWSTLFGAFLRQVKTGG